MGTWSKGAMVFPPLPSTGPGRATVRRPAPAPCLGQDGWAAQVPFGTRVARRAASGPTAAVCERGKGERREDHPDAARHRLPSCDDRRRPSADSGLCRSGRINAMLAENSQIPDVAEQLSDSPSRWAYSLKRALLPAQGTPARTTCQPRFVCTCRTRPSGRDASGPRHAQPVTVPIRSARGDRTHPCAPAGYFRERGTASDCPRSSPRRPLYAAIPRS
jgi:hypothetical protein